jgi:hypothetical protein
LLRAIATFAHIRHDLLHVSHSAGYAGVEL